MINYGETSNRKQGFWQFQRKRPEPGAYGKKIVLYIKLETKLILGKYTTTISDQLILMFYIHTLINKIIKLV